MAFKNLTRNSTVISPKRGEIIIKNDTGNIYAEVITNGLKIKIWADDVAFTQVGAYDSRLQFFSNATKDSPARMVAEFPDAFTIVDLRKSD